MKIKHLSFTTILLTAVLISFSFGQDNTQVGLPEGAIARLGKGGINIMRFSPDGTRLAVGTNVGVWLYDVPDGKETALFTGKPGQVNALAFSHDSKILASGGFNNPVIQLWDVSNSNKLSTFKTDGRSHAISALAFSEDNATLISLVMFGHVILWDVKTGSKALFNLRSMHLNKSTAISQNGSIFVIGEDNGKINLWDVNQRSKRETLKGHSSLFKGKGLLPSIVSGAFNLPQNPNIWSLTFSSNGKMLASGSLDRTVQLWDIEKSKKLVTFKGHKGGITAVAFSKDGNTLASGDEKNVIKLWDLKTKQNRATLNEHTNGVYALAFSPDGKTLASGSSDGTIRFWNPVTGRKINTFSTGHIESVQAIAFSVNDSTLSSAAFNGTVDVWNLKSREEINTFIDAQNDSCNAVVLSSDAKLLACQGSNSILFNPSGISRRGGGKSRDTIQLWDVDTSDEIFGPWQNIKATTNALSISPDNNILAANIEGKGISLWNVNVPIKLLISHFDVREPFTRSLLFSPNGKHFATYGTYVQTQIWNVVSQEKINPPLMGECSAIAFSPDSTLVAQSNHHQDIVLWNVTPTGMNKRSSIPDSKGDFHNLLLFSPDAKILLDPDTFGWGIRIVLWDVVNGSSLGSLSGHTERITTLVFSHDGKILASGAKDGTVLLWDWEKIVTKARKNKGN